MPAVYFEEQSVVMIRIPKTGSTSIIRGLFGSRKNGVLETEAFPETWKDYYSFAFTRNPYDRLISSLLMFQNYRQITPEEETVRDSLTLDKLMDIIEDESINFHERDFLGKLRLHSLPMTHPSNFIDHAKEIFSFEYFNTAYQTLAKKLNIEIGSEIPHLKKKNRKPYQRYYTPSQKERASKLFAEDLERFNYTF